MMQILKNSRELHTNKVIKHNTPGNEKRKGGGGKGMQKCKKGGLPPHHSQIQCPTSSHSTMMPSALSWGPQRRLDLVFKVTLPTSSTSES